MIDILLEIANRLELRVQEFDSFPRTQATDAMKGIGTDIVKIIRETINDSGATEVSSDGINLDDRINKIVSEVVDGLFGDEPKGDKK